VLTRVEINGFKSFQDFALDFEPLLMVLGPNSAGKSNLFDALALISRLSSMEISKALQGGRGSIRDQFSRTPTGIANEMSFAVELLVSDDNQLAELAQTRFRYELIISHKRLSSGVEELNVAHERLRPIVRAADKWLESHSAYSPFVRYDAPDVLLALEFGEPDMPRAAVSREYSQASGRAAERDVRELPLVAEKTLLAEVFGRHITAVRHELRSWRFLHLGMVALRTPSEPGASARLVSDGSNLPTALAALSEEVRARLQADMAELVPGLASLQVTIGNDDLGVEATFSDGQKYSQRVMSDGTLRLLALLTMLHSSEPGGLVAWEEPENGLHPGRLRELLRRLRELVQRDDALPVQILMNGHSPAIVAGLYDLPGSLALADLVRRNGGPRRTRVRRVAASTQPSDPFTTVSMREIEALLEAARPEPAE